MVPSSCRAQVCSKPAATAVAGGKSGISAAGCAAVVDGGEEVEGGEEFSAAGSEAGDSGSFCDRRW